MSHRIFSVALAVLTASSSAWAQQSPAAWAQQSPSASPPTTAPASVAPPVQPPGGMALLDSETPDTSGIAIGTLSSVRLAFLQTMPWQTAELTVLDKIEPAGLKQQAAEGLNALSPRITRALMDRPNDSAFVSVAVYRKATGPGQIGEQAAVSLTFEGFSKRMDDGFFPRVLSDMPRRPDEPNSPAPGLLVLDPVATGYLCFTVNTDGLVAAIISHTQMKRDIANAVARGLSAPARRAEAPLPPPVSAAESVNAVGNVAPPAVVAPDNVDYGPPALYADWGSSAWWWDRGPNYVPSYVYDLYGYSAYNPLVIYSDGYYHRGWNGDWHNEWSRHAGVGRTPVASGSPRGGGSSRNFGTVPPGIVPWANPRIQGTGLRPVERGTNMSASGLRLDPNVGLRLAPSGLRQPPTVTPGGNDFGSFGQSDVGFRGGVPGYGQRVVNPAPPGGRQAPSLQQPAPFTPAGRLAGVAPDQPTPPAARAPAAAGRGPGGASRDGGGRR